MTKLIALIVGLFIFLGIAISIFTQLVLGYDLFKILGNKDLILIKTPRQQDCEKEGGYWYQPDSSSDYLCDLPPKDTGKACYEQSDCEVDCIHTGEKDEEGYLMGKCGEYSITKCSPRISTKSKDPKVLYFGSCV